MHDEESLPLDDAGRLEWARRPIAWSEYEPLDDPPALRIRYSQSGSARGPNFPVAEIHVEEDERAVRVGMFERALSGITPDGGYMGELLANVTSWVEVRLEYPLGDRPVCDASTGRRASAITPEPRPGRGRYGDRGCPVWKP